VKIPYFCNSFREAQNYLFSWLFCIILTNTLWLFCSSGS